MFIFLFEYLFYTTKADLLPYILKYLLSCPINQKQTFHPTKQKEKTGIKARTLMTTEYNRKKS